MKERDYKRTKDLMVYISVWYHSKRHFHFHWLNYSIKHVRLFARCVVLPSSLWLFSLSFSTLPVVKTLSSSLEYNYRRALILIMWLSPAVLPCTKLSL